MSKRYNDFRRLGGDVVGVSFAEPRVVGVHLSANSYPFPLVSDPKKIAYHAFGLERTTWRGIIRPKVILRYLVLIMRGWRPRRVGEETNVLQLGGNVVIDRDRRLRFVHRSAEPTDRPSVDALLKEVGKAT